MTSVNRAMTYALDVHAMSIHFDLHLYPWVVFPPGLVTRLPHVLVWFIWMRRLQQFNFLPL